MSPDEIIAVVQAHKEGKEIELQPRGVASAGWAYTFDPVWDFYHFNYRAKPNAEPNLVVTIRFWLTQAGGLMFHHCLSDANLRLTFDRETGKLKAAEVL